MRDGKLYKELGYQNFEEYCENGAGIGRRHAYRFITILETLPPDFVTSMSQIGMTKLTLLTALTDDQREELTQTVDLESTTVRELKAQIAALQSQNADTEKARADAEERAQKWYDEAQDAQEAKERNRLTLVGLMEKKQEPVRQLEAKIKELENQPQDVAVVDRTEEIDRLNAEIADLREKLAEKPDMQLPMNVEPIYQQDTKAVYNAYLRSVTTTLENLCRFIRTNRSDKNHDYFEENFRLTLENAVKSIEEE
jgi:chromosome segregation ATPase